MNKFIEGPVQVSTKHDNTNKNATGALAGTSFNVEELRQLFGNLWTASPLTNTSGLDDNSYQQSLDLNTSYAQRSLPLHTNFLTAEQRNARNDFIVLYATPIFQTVEQHFHVTHTEWNQIEYDDLPEGGIANEPTFTKWGWTDTTRKKKQELHFSVDLANDPIYGVNTFVENFSALASNCLLSIYKDAYYSIVHTAYQQKIYDRNSNRPFDMSKVYMSEMEAFFAFALDPAVGFKLIRDEVRERDGLDLVIMPEGGTQWVQELGSIQRQLPTRQLAYNNATKKFEQPVDKPGPMTYKSFKLGDNWLDFMEARSFTVNSLDKRKENPLSTKLTQCQFYPPNSDCKPGDDPVSNDPQQLDMWIFHQTKDEGEDRRIAFKDMLKYCGYWDPKSGLISDDVKEYIESLNAKKATDRTAPWQFHGQDMPNDVNEDIGDYENPSAMALNAIGNGDDLTRMTSIRDKCVVSLYDTTDGQYKEVPYIACNNLDTLSNEWIMKVAKSLTRKFHSKIGTQINSGLQHLFGLLSKLERGHITQAYLHGLINANMPAVSRNGEVTPYTKNGIPEFVANNHGSLRLPASTSVIESGIIYPNGFHSGPGLLTLRDELLKVGSQFQPVALEANQALDFVSQLIAFIRLYIGNTEIVDPTLAAPWFQFDAQKKAKDAEIATFIDAIYKRGVPVFLGVPEVATFPEIVDVPMREKDESYKDTENLIGILKDNPLDKITLEVLTSSGLYPILTDSIRTLACLSKPIAEKYKLRILENPAGKLNEYKVAMDAYFKCIISQGRLSSKEVVNLKTANAITETFYTILGEHSFEDGKEKNNKKEALDAYAFIERVSNSNTASSEAVKLMKTQAYKEEGISLSNVIKEYEAFLSKRQIKPKKDEDSVEPKIVSVNPTTNTFEGDYTYSAPLRYMRSPLMSSDVLIDFIRVTGVKWALPGDEATLYTSPDVSAKDEYNDVDMTPEIMHSRFSGAFNLLNSRFSPEENTFGGFASSGLSSGNLFQFGAPSFSTRRMNEKVSFYTTKQNDKEEQTMFLQQKYPGPINARMKYYDNIDDELQKIFFLALLEAENTLWTHHKLADIGAQLINVLIFRPFIEFFACSIIVMKAGEESGAVPISRFDTYISRDDRGYFHIGCSYYSGFIRLGPQNFRMISYCIPDRFVGGKKTDVMINREQWVPNNPGKPSMIFLPIPIAERTYGTPIHMLNEKTIQRPDIDYPTWTTKYSSAGFYEHRFTADNVRHVDELHYERIKYKSITHASHVAHRGWRAFKDPSNGVLREFDGYGPGCQRRMNQPGCQQVWNGKVTLFDKEPLTQYTRARAL